MDTDIDRQPVRHPWRSRQQRGLSLTTFAAMLRQHIFLFRRANPPSHAPHDYLEYFVPALERERTILEMAWEGGDQFVEILSAHYAKQRHETIPGRTDDDIAAEVLIRVLDEDLRMYALALGQHDWAWEYNDDEEYRDKMRKDEHSLLQTCNEKQGYHQKLWDYYINQRNERLKRPHSAT